MASISSSSSSRLIARTPTLRILEYSLRLVRLTIPFRVKKTRLLSSLKSVVGMIALIFSSLSRLIRLTTALPLAARETSGIR